MNTNLKEQVLRYILYIFSEERIILNTYLTKLLTKKFNLSRFQVYRLIKTLEKEQAIKINRISKKLYELEMADPHKLIDLINRGGARNHNTMEHDTEHEPDRKELLRHARQLLKPRWSRINSYHKKAVDEFMLMSTLDEEDKKDVTALFECWLDDIKDKILMFITPDGGLEFLPYTTRFNSKAKAIEILKKAENCFKTAQSIYNNGVFLTITLPPIFPQRLALWILTFLVHRIKALIRKQYKESKPHIRVNEPQNSWNPHTHLVIFGIDYLMDKHELTRYLDKHLINFLQNLGRHYKKTINNRASEYDILALNELGQVFIKKYNKYKRQHPKFEGVINWITRIKVDNGTLVFENPPPDRQNKKGQTKTMKDGGYRIVFDYLKYYIMSNVVEAKKIEENEISKVNNYSLVWYWFHRMPFFFASPILRINQEKRIPAGWEFVGSFRVSQDNFIYELMQQSKVQVIYKYDNLKAVATSL